MEQGEKKIKCKEGMNDGEIEGGGGGGGENELAEGREGASQIMTLNVEALIES